LEETSQKFAITQSAKGEFLRNNKFLDISYPRLQTNDITKTNNNKVISQVEVSSGPEERIKKF